jgi:biotin transport system substrate-specific component
VGDRARAEHGRDRFLLTAFLAYVIGQLIIFVVGLPWLRISGDLPWATAIHDGFTIVVVGGLIKAAAGGVLTPTAWRLVRRSERGN